MASHDLINTKPTILGATLGAIPGVAANPHEIFTFDPAFSERFFRNWGGPRAQEYFNVMDLKSLQKIIPPEFSDVMITSVVGGEEKDASLANYEK